MFINLQLFPFLNPTFALSLPFLLPHLSLHINLRTLISNETELKYTQRRQSQRLVSYWLPKGIPLNLQGPNGF